MACPVGITHFADASPGREIPRSRWTAIYTSTATPFSLVLFSPFFLAFGVWEGLGFHIAVRPLYLLVHPIITVPLPRRHLEISSKSLLLPAS